MNFFIRIFILLLMVDSIYAGNTTIGNTGNNRTRWNTFVTFASGAGVQNQIIGFTKMIEGFAFEDRTTTCTYDAFGGVEGGLGLRQGRLYLFGDLFFYNRLNVMSPGWIYGNNHAVIFPSQPADYLTPAVTTTASMFFDTTRVEFNTNTTLQCPFQFRNSCTLNCNNHRLTLSQNAPIIVRDGTLTIENTFLDLTTDASLRCLLTTDRLRLRNCKLMLSRNYSFTQGGITFSRDNIITGTSKFTYSSTTASTISANSVLMFDHGTTFSYAPTNARRDLLFMTDQSSALYLNGCTLHSTRTGMQLSRGTVLFDNKVTMSSEARNSGEAMLIGSDLTAKVLSSALIDVYGHIKVF